jgi:Tol biopolymer transport system component
MNRPHTNLTIATLTVACSMCLGFVTTPSADELISGQASEGLVFVAATDEGMDLWRARISDGALQRVTSTPDQEERWPAWSGASQRLAFIMRNSTGFMKANIMLLDISKGEEENLGPEPDLFQHSHTWSPDGKHLAHTYRVPATQGGYISASGAAIVEIGKTNRVSIAKIEETQQDMVQLDYSSDGKSLVAVGRNDSNQNGDKLWILQPNKKPRQLGGIQKGIYGRPYFTRDDKVVVFTYQLNQSPRDIMTVNLAPKSRARRIARYPGSDDYTAVPSPTRDEIVFISNRDGSPDLFLMDLAGGKPVSLTKGSKGAEVSPVWSPDGEHIAYVVIPEAKYQAEEKDHSLNKIRVMDRSGKVVFETAGVMPSWMPPWTGDMPLSPPGAEGSPESE